jgi:uncharacterized protein
MSGSFIEPDIQHQERYREYLSRCAQKTSDYSFANIYGWAEEYGLTWRFDEHCVWIRQTRPDPVYWAPVGDWERMDWERCDLLRPGVTIIRVPEALAMPLRESLGSRLELAPEREHWDYVYRVADMVALDSGRLRKKRELLEEFQRSYEYLYLPMGAECVEEVLEMQEQWCTWHECDDSEALIAENQAIARVVQQWDNMEGLLGASLHVQGEMVAYTVAEELDPDTLVVHFEKGRSEFTGVYQAINQMFLEDKGQGYTYVNREQDLGDAGLRKSKLSYDPPKFIKKYEVRVV